MVKNETTKKKFSQARKSIDKKHIDLQKEVKDKLNDLLEKTYKHFEKT
ncbi:MAG: hypothetical protein QF381_01875 [Nitrososphaerales archaeon]|jgi:hypothetical protein|nr:hypothetical protein [Nitrososphaerales archaeon]|tara:strand:+ start:1594 stop:1737 length:144 start_codon:yes stop_codon:yes gene_type:complete